MSVKKIKLTIEVKVPDGATHYAGNIDDTFVTWYKKDGDDVWKWVWDWHSNDDSGSWVTQNAQWVHHVKFRRLPPCIPSNLRRKK